MKRKQGNEFLYVKDVADISGLSVSKIYQEIHSNNLEFSRIGKKYRIEKNAVDIWMQRITGGKK